MRGCTLSSRCLGRLLLCALASRAGAAGLPGTPTLPVPSCPAQVEQGMVAGDDGSGQRPSSLLQMTSPRRTTAPVHEDAEPEAQTPDHNQGLRIVRLLWKNPYATALGQLSDANMLILPVAAALSIVFSCSVVVCFVVAFRPRRGKNLDSQFEPVRLGLPPGYGCKALRSNCW
ncbi:unnamed protein product [Effrenium voratum]|uniref:Uncharacterized protein n=1 Tax=Effrenium voratum TaxID=2562239 RepID=A0AA36I4Q2_9DINO|nr:unnamed protein product [Effrenium voratum]